MQLSFSFLAVATAFAAAGGLSLVSAHPAQQLKRVTTTTPPPSPTSTTDAGIPTHASTVTNALPAAIKTTPPSSCTFFFFLFFLFYSPSCLLSFFIQPKRGENFSSRQHFASGPPSPPPHPKWFIFTQAKTREKSCPFSQLFFFFSLYITENRTRFN